MIEFDLAAYLLSRPAVSAIVDTRIFPERAPQAEPKLAARIVYRLLPGAERFYHTTGPSGFVEADIELTFTATTYAAARDLYDAVRLEIDGTSATWGTTTVNKATISTPVGATGDPVQGDDVGFPSVRAIVNVWYYEALS
jgi:hypothetical protein